MAVSGVLFVICIPSSEQEKRMQSEDISSSESLNSSKLYRSNHSVNDKDNVFNDNIKPNNNTCHLPSRLGRFFSEVSSVDTNKQTTFSANKIDNKFRTKSEDIQTKQEVTKENEKPSMEKRIEKCLLDLKIENAVWSTDRRKNYYQVSFCVASGDACEEVLRVLSEFQIGLELDSTVSVIPCSLHYEGNIKRSHQRKPHSEVPLTHQQPPLGLKEITAWDRFVNSVRARLTVAEVIAGFKANAFLTFDFVVLLIIAAIIAALGLVESSTVILVASMLISPLMRPIMAGTFGFMIKDRNLQTLGIMNELFGLLLCVVIGYLFGIIVGLSNIQWGNGFWPTEEMRYKGEIRSLWVGAIVALPSGAAVAIAVLGDNTESLIGVAISLSLMPPAVNAGLLWALATVTYLLGPNANNPFTNLATEDHVGELTRLGAISLCLTFVNIVCIFVSSIIVFKIKEVTPRGPNDYSRHFWKETFKIARDYKHLSNEDLNLGRRLVEEMENQATTNDDLHSINLFKNHPNFRRLNQYTWSPCSSYMCPRPSAQEVTSMLHHPLSQVPCILPGAANWRTGTQPNLSYILNTVNLPTFSPHSNDSPSSQLSAILESQRSPIRQVNLPDVYSRRFVVTPASDP